MRNDGAYWLVQDGKRWQRERWGTTVCTSLRTKGGTCSLGPCFRKTGFSFRIQALSHRKRGRLQWKWWAPCHQSCVNKGRNGIEGIPASNRELKSLKVLSALSFDSDAKSSTEHTTYFLFLTLSDLPRCLEYYSQHFPPQKTTSVSCINNSSLPLILSMGKWYWVGREPHTHQTQPNLLVSSKFKPSNHPCDLERTWPPWVCLHL